MKIFAASYDFPYSWDEVSVANWRKYSPWNKESSHVVAVDTLSRELDPKTGILRTERLITCRQPAPKWIKPFLGSNEVSHVYEVSYIRPTTSTTASSSTSSLTSRPSTPMSSPASSSSRLSTESDPTDAASTISPAMPSVTMTSQNLTWKDLLSVRETVVYTPSPADPTSSTKFDQHASITALCGGWQRVRERIEGFTLERFGQNAERGKRGFEMVLGASRDEQQKTSAKR